MVRDDQEHGGQQPRDLPTADRALRVARGPAFRLAALALASVTVASATGFLMAPWLAEPERNGSSSGASAQAEAPIRRPLFHNWGKPDVVLVLTGQEHGYLQPCGCSRPQLGGLARRYNFMETLRQRGWPVVAVDVGDVPQRSGPQALLKYETSMYALKALGYSAVTIGLNEGAMPLFQALGQFSLNEPSPRVVAANLKDKNLNFPGMVNDWEVVGGQKEVPRVGIVGAVSRPVAEAWKQQDPTVLFDPADRAVRTALPQLLAQHPEVLVLLFQGLPDEAHEFAKKFPNQFHVILCLTKEEEPPGQPEREGNTLIIGVGHKGRYVGVLGVSRTGQRNAPFRMNYDLVAMGEDYETPEGREAGNPIHALLERYAQDVKKGNYLARYAQTRHPLQVAFPEATYVGSEKCKRCHEHAYNVWKKEIWNESMKRNESHSHAYADLVSAKRPSLRQYDGECVKCHVVGFESQTGYKNEAETPKLVNVGCESCHGPGSLHANGDNSNEMLAKINPFKATKNETPTAMEQRLNKLDAFCQKCHDTDNDVHWNINKWEKIAHPEPPQAAVPAKPPQAVARP